MSIVLILGDTNKYVPINIRNEGKVHDSMSLSITNKNLRISYFKGDEFLTSRNIDLYSSIVTVLSSGDSIDDNDVNTEKFNCRDDGVIKLDNDNSGDIVLKNYNGIKFVVKNPFSEGGYHNQFTVPTTFTPAYALRIATPSHCAEYRLLIVSRLSQGMWDVSLVFFNRRPVSAGDQKSVVQPIERYHRIDAPPIEIAPGLITFFSSASIITMDFSDIPSPFASKPTSSYPLSLPQLMPRITIQPLPKDGVECTTAGQLDSCPRIFGAILLPFSASDLSEEKLFKKEVENLTNFPSVIVDIVVEFLRNFNICF
jgi:hypothetical protein